jgi:ArsR family transcriptional regulator, arsenate/arsenite/antimonite-responsive transcriptional repressor
MHDVVSIIKAAADPTRMRILMSLSAGELCVCQMVELLGLAPSTVSKHVSILKQARLVESRKEGRWIFCRLARHDAAPARDMFELLAKWLSSDSQIREDAARLEEIRKMNREDLCQKQNRC